MRVGKWVERLSLVALSLGVSWSEAYAAGAGGTLPWDTTLTTLQTDAQGTVAHAITVGAIVAAGIGWAFSEHGTGLRKGSAVAFGGAAALGSDQVITGLFGGAALI